MASLNRDSKSPNYSIRFRYDGRNVNRSLGTGDRRKATGIRSRIEETLLLLESGRIEIPVGADPVAFIFSDGKQTTNSKTNVSATVSVPFLKEEAGYQTLSLAI